MAARKDVGFESFDDYCLVQMHIVLSRCSSIVVDEDLDISSGWLTGSDVSERRWLVSPIGARNVLAQVWGDVKTCACLI